MEEILDQPTVEETPTAEATPLPTPEDNVQYVSSPKEARMLRSMQKHQQKVLKARQERWSQPFSNAKVEDLMMLADDFRKVLNDLEIVKKTLIKKVILTQEDLNETIKYETERLKKYEELKADTTMTAEDKKAVAQEWNIPLELLGLSAEPTETDGK